MIIHLAVPTHSLQESMPIYEHMIKAIHSEGCSLARDWIRPAYHHPEDLENDDYRAEVVRQVNDAILRADAVIADVSDHGTFGVGIQVAYALQLKKPVLAVLREGTAEGILARNIDSPYYQCRFTSDPAATIRDFLADLRSGEC